jgi:tetratricopeptide (TPR) repeat protein
LKLPFKLGVPALLLSLAAAAQVASAPKGETAVSHAPGETSGIASHTLLLLPFDPASSESGTEWIGETFPEVLGQCMQVASLYIVPRDDRISAFDHAGIPANAHPSHATLFHIGQEVDADYLVLGRYNVSGGTLKAEAQLLNIRGLRLSAPLSESGPLSRLVEIESALGSDLLWALDPAHPAGSHRDLTTAAPAVRLDALENYILGITATDSSQRIRRLHEALKVDSSYVPAMIALGRAYYGLRDYESAAAWLVRVPRSNPAAREASFYAGLAYYHLGEFEKAENAFAFVASQFPLTEVYNNLGVAQLLRGKTKAASVCFQKAVEADPYDPDYRFNLALALYKMGDNTGAMRELREAAKVKTPDADMKSLLSLAEIPKPGVTGSQATPSATLPVHRAPGTQATPVEGPSHTNVAVRLPRERIKPHYNESSFRQLALDIHNTNEQRWAGSDPHQHAIFHVEHGQELLKQNFVAEAAIEFREATYLDPSNASAHAGLAHALEKASTGADFGDFPSSDETAARREAQAALRLEPSVEAYLVLARLDLREYHAASAAENVNRALSLDSSNEEAFSLKRSMSARQAETPASETKKPREQK